MICVTTVFAVGFTVLAAGEPVKTPTKETRGGEVLRCEKIKVVEVADDQGGKVAVRTPGEIPLDTKLVKIGKHALSIQPVGDKGKPALDLQTFRIVNVGTTVVHAVQESTTNITALAMNRTTGSLVLSRATAGDKVAPGTAGHIAYFHCSRVGK